MALHQPKELPETFWLPVLAVEAEARIELVTKLSAHSFISHEETTAIVVKYASTVADGFAQQACAAAKLSDLPLVKLDKTIDGFLDVLLHHCYFDIQHPRIVQNWAHRGSNFSYELKPKVLLQPWHRRYLAEVPKILASILKPELALSQIAEKRRTFVQPRLASLGLTVSSWAERAGVDASVAYDYMNGKTNPRAENRRALAEVLEVKPPELP